MSVFLYIIGHNIVPVFIIIGIGFILDKKLDFNISTLSKLTFYFLVPVFIFINLYTTKLESDLLKVLMFSLVYLVISDLLSGIVAGIRKYDIGMTNAFKNSILFNNSGNLGISLITLVFGSAPFVIDGRMPYLDIALAVQIMITVFNSTTVNTLGFYIAGRAKMKFKDSVGQIFAMPIIYVIPLALLIRCLKLDITATPIWPALTYINDGFISMSLFTLGVQLSKTEFKFGDVDVHLSVIMRLIVGPIIAMFLIYFFRFSGVIAQALLISFSMPTAVNTALIAVECDNNKHFASQAVVVSTIFSAVTLTLVIYIAKILFPVIVN